MSQRECVQDGTGDIDRQLGRERTRGQSVSDRAAVDVLHHDGQPVALGHQVADGDDVRVPQTDQDGPLAEEAADQLVVLDELGAE